MAYIFTVDQFIEKLKFAASKKTLYIKGCFGAPMNATNKKRYTTNLQYNKNRANIINAATADTFGFDCNCLIKGILWGWSADQYKNYGGATYKSNGVPDFGADNTLDYCTNVSTDFNNIVPGEVVWMPGHVGVYIGNGQVIECTPKWTNNVQYSYLANIGYKTGNYRTWNRHGKLQWINYNVVSAPAEQPVTKPVSNSVYHVVQKGDSLYKIGKKYGISWTVIAKNNGIKAPWIIHPGQNLKIK